MSFEFWPTNDDEKSGGNSASKREIMKEVQSTDSFWKRSSSGHRETESPARPVLTYRPKPAFGVDSTCCASSVFSASSSIRSSGAASMQSTASSPLSSTCGKSSDWMSWSSPKRAVAAGGGDDHDNSPLSPKRNGGGVCSKSMPNGVAVDPGKLDVERVSSWSQYLDSSGETYYETAEQRHTVDMSQLFLGQKFACGMYSRLYRGQYHNREVAVKILRQPDEDEEVAKKLERQFHQEVSLLSSLHHVNIVQFLGALKKPPVFCIITEYLAGGSLRAFLHKTQPDTLAMDMVLALALDIARGMEYMHSQGVLHLDLKSHNLILGDNNRVKVTDFGVARTQSECESMTPDSGTYRWMAPEMISSKTFSTKADVYSFGIVLWEILTGEIPYHDMSSIQAAFAVVDKHERPPIPDNCPRPLKQLMEECWAANPEKRPSYYEIVKRLDQFQDCARRNEALRYCGHGCEKRHWFRPYLQKLTQACLAHKQMSLDD